MPRSRHFLGLLLVLTAAAEIALAQPPRNPPPNRPAPTAVRPSAGGGAMAAQPSKYLMIPGLMPLSMEGVLQDIGISAEQRQQLKALSDGYQTSAQKIFAPLREMAPEDQQKAAGEIREQVGQLARSTQRKAESILSPQQLQAVQKISFQLSVGQAMTDAGAQEKIGVSAEQRQKISAIYEQANAQMQKLQRESAERVMQILNEDQVSKLHQMMESQQKPQQ